MAAIASVPTLIGMDLLRFRGGGGFALLLFVLVIALLVGWALSRGGTSARY
jgi:hypothetical protein